MATMKLVMMIIRVLNRVVCRIHIGHIFFAHAFIWRTYLMTIYYIGQNVINVSISKAFVMGFNRQD